MKHFSMTLLLCALAQVGFCLCDMHTPVKTINIHFEGVQKLPDQFPFRFQNHYIITPLSRQGFYTFQLDSIQTVSAADLSTPVVGVYSLDKSGTTDFYIAKSPTGECVAEFTFHYTLVYNLTISCDYCCGFTKGFWINKQADAGNPYPMIKVLAGDELTVRADYFGSAHYVYPFKVPAVTDATTITQPFAEIKTTIASTIDNPTQKQWILKPERNLPDIKYKLTLCPNCQ